MSVKVMKKQVSLPVNLAPSEPDLSGEKDVDPLLENSQRIGKETSYPSGNEIFQPSGNEISQPSRNEKKKRLYKSSKSLDYDHPISSPQIPYHPLLAENVEVKKKMFSKTSTSFDYEQPIHPIPSSQIVLSEEEKLELESVLFEKTLQSVGLR